MRTKRWTMSRSAVLATAIASAMGTALAGAFNGCPWLLYNHTPSVPVGFYYLCDDSPNRHIQLGDLVAFRLPKAARDYAHRRGESADVLLLKPVRAMSGDRVSTLHGELRINGALVGAIPDHDSAGRALPHWRADRVLKDGELLVISTRIPNSFDSRFFGPIHISQVVGVYRSLWTCRTGEAPPAASASLLASQGRSKATEIQN